MAQQNENPAVGAAGSGVPISFEADASNLTKDAPNTQAKSRNPRAVFERTQGSLLADAHELLGGLTAHAAIAQQFAEIGDARGFLYSLGRTVDHAVRAGDLGVALREVRIKEKERRSALKAEGRQ